MEGSRALGLARVAASVEQGARVRSVACLSTCSGRGVCDRATRSCRCDAFWMQSLLTQLDADAMPDCDWSVVYASLGGVAALCALGGAGYGCVRALQRLCAPRKMRARPKYRLLPLAGHEDTPCKYCKMRARPKYRLLPLAGHEDTPCKYCKMRARPKYRLLPLAGHEDTPCKYCKMRARPKYRLLPLAGHEDTPCKYCKMRARPKYRLLPLAGHEDTPCKYCKMRARPKYRLLPLAGHEDTTYTRGLDAVTARLTAAASPAPSATARCVNERADLRRPLRDQLQIFTTGRVYRVKLCL
ncbi:hypothetical protein ACJJTC_001019 [Scirpophaga incertulas]